MIAFLLVGIGAGAVIGFAGGYLAGSSATVDLHFKANRRMFEAMDLIQEYNRRIRELREGEAR